MSFKQQLQRDYAILQAKGKDSAVRQASIRKLHRLILPHIGRGRQAALDLGAGQGELVEALQRLGYSSVQGVELSASQVQQAELHGCSLEAADALRFLQAQPDGGLDLVTCFDVFEHLPHPVCAAWFDQIARVLRPGGRLIGHVPNGLSPFVGSVFWGDLTHVWCPVPQSVQVFCRTSGLRWLGAHENIGDSPSLKGRLRWLAWLAVRRLLVLATTVETGRPCGDWAWSRTFLFVAEKPS